MDISLAASLSGVKTTQTKQDVTAHNVANVNSAGYSMIDAQATDVLSGGSRISVLRRIPNPSPDTSNTDLAQATGQQIENKIVYKANLQVIKVQDEMLGELLDLNA